MQLLIKGLITGFVIILPGMSGGTLLLLLGLYEKLMHDLANFRLFSWLPFLVGAVGGILLSGVAFSWLLDAHTPIVLSFLLGCILASVRAVLGGNYRPTLRRVVLLAVGAVIGFILASEPMSIVEETTRPGMGLLLIGGALACTTMILPGVPGSSVLILMGIYDDMFVALAELDWLVLLVFGLGAVIGVFGFSNALDKVYSRYRASISWLFSGLIIGSARMLVPTEFDNPVLMVGLGIAGFSLVWWWGEK